jgi:hypothetical protein
LPDTLSEECPLHPPPGDLKGTYPSKGATHLLAGKAPPPKLHLSVQSAIYKIAELEEREHGGDGQIGKARVEGSRRVRGAGVQAHVSHLFPAFGQLEADPLEVPHRAQAEELGAEAGKGQAGHAAPLHGEETLHAKTAGQGRRDRRRAVGHGSTL